MILQRSNFKSGGSARRLAGEKYSFDPAANGVCSKADEIHLVNRLRPLLRGEVNGTALFHAPEADSLLTIDPENVYDRTAAFIMAVNMVSTLLMSGIISNALSPLNISQLDAEKRTAGDVFNGLVCVLTVINTLQSLFTTYLLIELSVAQPRALYRSIARSGAIVFYQQMTFVSAVLVCCTACLALHIHSSRRGAWVTSAICVAGYAVYHTHFFGLALAMFPTTMVPWARLFAPWMLTANIASDASRLATNIAAGATAHFPELDRFFAMEKRNALHEERDATHPPNDKVHPATAEEAPARVDPDYVALYDFISETLPAMPQERVDFVVDALLREGLAYPVLCAAAKHGNGITAVFHALDIEGVEYLLRRGERLTIAAAASNVEVSTNPIRMAPNVDDDQTKVHPF